MLNFLEGIMDFELNTKNGNNLDYVNAIKRLNLGTLKFIEQTI